MTRDERQAVAHGDLRRIGRAELPADTPALARFLLGKLVIRERPEGDVIGRIVETEAYVVGDAASHAYRGVTSRNRSLFLQPGHAYVYLAYGVSFMLNVSSGAAGIGEGVLIRALEPVAGVGFMESRRGTSRLRDLARGPGRLTQALAIDRRLDGADLCAPGEIWLGADGFAAGAVGTSVRIGITRDADRPLRFFLRGNVFVSGPGALNL
ncbi:MULTISPECIES: DNA-3-methyladenine glycosylase [Rhodomicrobium]|uniref:DNA-3-methyladenine glycosylase n=1 Tax=Rhodomicrobium TaxID=1068 RepID=UPI000B4A67ED|nr:MULTISPECIES: DNA-3-methyladenine glycosylase [Rhodomicrobium]